MAETVELQDIYDFLDNWESEQLELIAERDELREKLEMAVEALRKAERNLYGNPSAWITHKVINDALAEISKLEEK